MNLHTCLDSFGGPPFSTLFIFLFFAKRHFSSCFVFYALQCCFPEIIIIISSGLLIHYHFPLKQLIGKDLFPLYRSLLSSGEAKCFVPWECIFIFIMEVNGS